MRAEKMAHLKNQKRLLAANVCLFNVFLRQCVRVKKCEWVSEKKKERTYERTWLLAFGMMPLEYKF